MKLHHQNLSQIFNYKLLAWLIYILAEKKSYLKSYLKYLYDLNKYISIKYIIQKIYYTKNKN